MTQPLNLRISFEHLLQDDPVLCGCEQHSEISKMVALWNVALCSILGTSAQKMVYVPPKHWHTAKILRRATTQKTTIYIDITIKHRILQQN
jgi:hypothetical protein